VSGGGESVDHIKRVFLESNPVLEAFGNAKTLRNNNSSRFGKYFELKFNHFGCPQGGVITNYLLEKSRVCSPGDGERNFHIFYQLHASDFASKLLLSAPEEYRNLSCSNCYHVEGLNDTEEFNITLEAMRAVGMGNSQIQMILSLVAAVMQLGNLEFRSEQVGDTEGSVVFNKEPLHKFCQLTKLNSDLVEHVLTFRSGCRIPLTQIPSFNFTFFFFFLYRELQTMAAGGRIETYEVSRSSDVCYCRSHESGSISFRFHKIQLKPMQEEMLSASLSMKDCSI
jgi:myosin I